MFIANKRRVNSILTLKLVGPWSGLRGTNQLITIKIFIIMLYYKVPKSLNGKQLYDAKRQRHTISMYAGELLTMAECRRFGLPQHWIVALEPIQLSRRKIYFFFGKRFSAEWPTFKR